MKLNDKQCRNAKPTNQPYKLVDGDGLYLQVKPNGSKYWRLKYYYFKKEKLLALGVYPLVTLAQARYMREEAKRILAAGEDPSASKKEKKRKAIVAEKNTFRSVALEWHEKEKERWSLGYAKMVLRVLESDVFPNIGHRPIEKIDAPELLDDVLRKIEKRGSYYAAGRIKQLCGQIFRYGIVTRKCRRDPSTDLKGALRTKRIEHFSTLEIKEMPEFLKTLEKNDIRIFPRTRRATKVLMLTMARTIEIISGKWEEIDFENAMWEIPAERMKMKRPHLIPLSKQVVTLLLEQKEETGHLPTPYVFPSQIRPLEHMSNNTILSTIKRMGYNGKMTGHGFRSLAMSTLKERLDYRHEIVDRQLAHVPHNKVDRAYDRAQFLEQRIVMMQEWADYIDEVAKGNVSGWQRKNEKANALSAKERDILHVY
ncbi:MAG: integrase arm-type DNA-binding domain-containing protein [Bacteroidetes bacterium]|nr:integrase arm-type DNA-binding domain-containing protein [Bacteroidota bacterium]